MISIKRYLRLGYLLNPFINAAGVCEANAVLLKTVWFTCDMTPTRTSWECLGLLVPSKSWSIGWLEINIGPPSAPCMTNRWSKRPLHTLSRMLHPPGAKQNVQQSCHPALYGITSLGNVHARQQIWTCARSFNHSSLQNTTEIFSASLGATKICYVFFCIKWHVS